MHLMHWSIKVYIIFIILATIFFIWDSIYGPPKKSCIEYCSKYDVQCQRDCEIEDDSNQVSF